MNHYVPGSGKVVTSPKSLGLRSNSQIGVNDVIGLAASDDVLSNRIPSRDQDASVFIT